MPTNMADQVWRTGSIFSCCKGLWDVFLHKPITTKHQSMFWLVSQSRRMSAICVGSCRWILLAAACADCWPCGHINNTRNNNFHFIKLCNKKGPGFKTESNATYVRVKAKCFCMFPVSTKLACACSCRTVVDSQGLLVFALELCTAVCYRRLLLIGINVKKLSF